MKGVVALSWIFIIILLGASVRPSVISSLSSDDVSDIIGSKTPLHRDKNLTVNGFSSELLTFKSGPSASLPRAAVIQLCR
jgi:hypothetical protein